MSSLAKFIPIELVNHILSFRPRHPDAELIKKYKEKVLIENFVLTINSLDYQYEYKKTFRQLHRSYIRRGKQIFSYKIRPNSIYMLKTKRYKNSDGFYWGTYYTEKKGYEEAEKEKRGFYYGDIYSFELVNINYDTGEEEIVTTLYEEDSEDEYDTDDEIWDEEEED